MRNTKLSVLINALKAKDQDPRLVEILRALNSDSRDVTTLAETKIDLTKAQENFVQIGDVDYLNPDFSLFLTEEDLESLKHHKDTHVSGGEDEFTVDDLIEALVKRIRSTTADLVFGTIVDGQFLKRSGTTIISGVATPTTYFETMTNGDPTFPEVAFHNGDIMVHEVPI